MNNKNPRLVPRRRLTITVLVLLALAILVRQLYALGDHAIVNVLTFAFVATAVTCLFVWYLLSDHSRTARVSVLAAALVGFAGFFTFFKVAHFSGELIPTFRWRWAQAQDELIGAPEPVATDGPDLKTTTKDDFPRFLGAELTNHVPQVTVDADWTAHPPKILWKKEIGAGWSAFAAVNGYAVTMEQRGQEEWVTCYKIDSGDLVWATPTPGRHSTTLGGIGPRSTPTIDDGRVYALGAGGLLQCLDGKDGKPIWQDDIPKRYAQSEKDAGYVAWGRSNSPLIVNDLVIVPAGGSPKKRVSLIAFDKLTGTKRWEGGDDYISYASPTVMTLLKQRQIVSVNENSVSGHDVQTGAVLWKTEWSGSSSGAASASQPIRIADDKLLVSKGYNVGAALLELKKSDAGIAVDAVWHHRHYLKTKFTNAIVLNNFAYALSDGILECVDVLEGKRMWKNRRGRFGQGQILGVGDKLLVMSEEPCILRLVTATPDKFEHLASFAVFPKSDRAWNHMCLYGTRLLVRNWQYAACIELPTK